MLKLSGPPSLPIVGNCLLLKEKNCKFFGNILFHARDYMNFLSSFAVLRNYVATAYGLYGSLVRVWVFLFPFFVVLQPDDLQVILSSKKHTNKVFFYRLMHNFLGNGLITSSGEKWSTHRKFIQPAFHLNILERFIGTFADCSQVLLDKLNKNECNDINIATYINNCVIDILNEAVLGVSVKSKEINNMEQSPFRQ